MVNVPICQRHTSEQGDCTKLLGFSPASYHDGPDLFSGQYTSDMWWIDWRLDEDFSGYFGFTL